MLASLARDQTRNPGLGSVLLTELPRPVTVPCPYYIRAQKSGGNKTHSAPPSFSDVEETLWERTFQDVATNFGTYTSEHLQCGAFGDVVRKKITNKKLPLIQLQSRLVWMEWH